MSILCWQGWRLEIPASWNPVKLEGDYDCGFIAVADLERPRFGLRWQKMSRKKIDAAEWARHALGEEVGRLAAAEAKDLGGCSEFSVSLLYIEPEPPGRDVWVAFSKTSGRGFLLSCHTRGEHLLEQLVIPKFKDLPGDEPMPWSIFELSCIVPAEMKLKHHRLNAGDLSLGFGRKGQQVLVRQLALAKVALSRQPLAKWLDEQQNQKHYRAVEKTREITVKVSGGGEIKGLSRLRVRRRRFFFLRYLPPQFVTYAMHDTARDRLVFLEATDQALADEVSPTIGWAWRIHSD